MNELFYFAFADLMIRAEYIKDTNSLRYASHRKMIYIERAAVENYLLLNVATKTGYYRNNPSFLVYLGIDAKVLTDYTIWKLRGKVIEIATIEKVLDESVSNLIKESMQAYYFEKIGETLIEIKSATNEDDSIILFSKLRELIEAYNIHTDKKITVEKVMEQKQ